MTANRSAGYTLLELLLVIAIMGMVTAIGGDWFFKVSDQWRIVSTRTELDAQADDIIESMQQDFTNALSPGVVAVPFKGTTASIQMDRFNDLNLYGRDLDRDTVSFPAESIVSSSDLWEPLEVTYSVVADPAANLMLLREARPLYGEGAGMARTQVGRGVLKFDVSYLGATDAQWQPEWSQTGAPAAVQVQFTLIDVDRPWEQVARKAVFPIHVK